MPPPIYKEQLDKIEKALIGNGREGLIPRMARIEEKIETSTNLSKEAKESSEKASEKADHAIDELKIAVIKLEGIVTSHIKTEHLSALMKKKEFWAFIVVGYIALHFISTYIPNLWNIIATLVGLPKLEIPLG
jgi:hypothetical protein